MNRIIRVEERGWAHEPDQRHAELIVQALGLEDANPVKTPGEEGRKGVDEEEDREFGKQEAREFRGIAARANYLAQDRIDIQYAVKELSRGMARPNGADLRRAKRLGRYLLGKARVVTEYQWQSHVEKSKDTLTATGPAAREQPSPLPAAFSCGADTS